MILHDLKVGEGRLVVWKSVEELEDLKNELQNSDTLEEYNKLSSDKRKREFLSVRVALKKVLGEENIIFYYPSGKPFLSKKHYNISISHSGCWIALFIHPNMSVGVDIELFTPKIEKLYKRFLSEKEQSYLYEKNDISKVRIAWSAKEALYKIIGNEAVDFATQLEIKPFDLKSKGEIEAEHLVTNKLYKLFYEITDEYVLAYCTK